MALLIWTLVIVALIGSYWLGYFDGKLAEKEKQLFERMDELIAKIPDALRRERDRAIPKTTEGE